MPDGHVNVGGVWKALTGLHVNVGGVWKAVQTGHINVGGVWKEFYNAIALALSGEAISETSLSSACTAGVRINSDGTMDRRNNVTYTQIDGATDWIIPNGAASSSYEVRITAVTWTSGSSFDSAAAADDVWIDLGTSREWNIVDAVDGPGTKKDVSFTIEIREGSSGPALVSGSYSLLAWFDSAP